MRILLILYRVISDIEHFKLKTEKIEGSKELSDHLLGIVHAKAITATPGSEVRSESSQPSTSVPSPSPEASNGKQEGES